MKNSIIVLYFVFLSFFVVFSYVFIDPGLIYFKIFFTNFFQLHREITTIIFTIAIFLFFAFYAFFLYFTQKNMVSRKGIITLAISSGIVLLFAYPAMVSFDIFNYIATAKVTFFYHENPYILMPIEFLHDPLLLFMHAANKTALYAPFWIGLTGVPYLLGFGNFLLTLFNFKLFVGLFYIATIFLLSKVTKNNFQLAFFALNPLVLLETWVSGHNDIVMMFLLLTSLVFLLGKQIKRGSLLFILSIFIKYVTAILIPLFIFQSIRPLTKKRFLVAVVVCMYSIFFLSSLREEIYPWYGLWFLLPSTLLAENNLLTWMSGAFSFSLLLRYIPFMLLGTYFGPTPMLKIVFMLVPVVLTLVAYMITQKKRQLV